MIQFHNELDEGDERGIGEIGGIGPACAQNGLWRVEIYGGVGLSLDSKTQQLSLRANLAEMSEAISYRFLGF